MYSIREENVVMSNPSLLLEDLECVQHDGKSMIKVPWDSADLIHERLQALGINSTLYLQPAGHEAYLETRDNLGLEQLRSLLMSGQAA